MYILLLEQSTYLGLGEIEQRVYTGLLSEELLDELLEELLLDDTELLDEDELQ